LECQQRGRKQKERKEYLFKHVQGRRKYQVKDFFFGELTKKPAKLSQRQSWSPASSEE
jgi:hypothetical protein